MKQPDIDEINNYLSKMKSILQSNEGKLLVMEDRDKNFVFSVLYSFNTDKIKEVLLNLDVQDFDKAVINRNENHSDQVLYIWRKVLELTAMDGSTDFRDVYIKTYLDEYNNTVVVISFHKDKDFN